MNIKKALVSVSVGFLFFATSVTASEVQTQGSVETADQEQSETIDTKSKSGDCECRQPRFLVQGKRRTEKPFQLHVVLTGGGLNNVAHGPGGGIHLGYQISKLLYLGLTSKAFYNDHNFIDDSLGDRYDNETLYLGQEGAKESTSEIDPRHLIEMRFFPWNFGLYFSAGILHFGKQKSTIEFKKRTRVIGENEYKTGLTATLEYGAWTGAAAGIGFNHIFESGFSLGAGFNLGLGLISPEVTTTSTSAVSVADMEDWQEQIERNEKSLPHMFHFGIGYAF